MTAAFARKPLGGSNVRRVESYQPRVAEISALEKEHETLSDAALRARSEEFKTQLADSRPLDARRDEHDKHNLATGVRAQMKSASLAVRPQAKGSEG